MAVATRGGTRWRRTGMLFLPALLVVGLLAVGSLFGVLPLRLSVVGQDFKISSNGSAIKTPAGLAFYPSQISMKDGTDKAILLAGLPEAQLPKGMCISLVLTFPVVGSNTIRLKTTGNTVAKEMTLSATALEANDATLIPSTKDGKPLAPDGSNIAYPVSIGKNAADLNGLPKGPEGTFGVDAPGSGQMSNLQASAQGAVISGTAALNGLGVKLGHGRGVDHGECF
ncbi:DUF6230 family protein [Antrihabitans cavernicola]|uniref:Cholesterol esterase n=1 Tax=Antrihabitans cavernicola TaxID=2495913 RepID=A0A5A7SF88_9NOCA|nr:DUF6230 family protein [Spelaeibacter cavernicola]KAA0023822.1 hypothetical protein FOY51_04275 [Spelaeibacter cavernicola]